MKRRITLALIMVLSLILASYNSFAQKAEELLPKAIQLEEVKGELYEAIKTYQLILDEYPDNREICAEAMLHLGMCYEKLGLDQARQTYRQVISKYPEQEDKTAIARDRISRLDVYTAELLAKAKEHLKKGNELFKRWEYESAIKEYENAVNCGPNTQLALNARYCIGQSWYRAGKYDEALATFTKLFEDNPRSDIAPVTELMVAQVKHTMENDKSSVIANNSPDENIIVDPKTGITYTKIKTFTGKNDVIDWSPSSLSPNGKFLLSENTVVPLDGSDPFKLIEMHAEDPKWSPDAKKVAFTVGDSSLFLVPVSPETGKATGPTNQLVNKDCNIYGIDWSPDSKTIFYSILDYQKKNYPEIWAMSVSNGFTQRLTRDSSMGVDPTCSPDGKTIAFRDMLTIYLCPSAGGVPKSFIKKEKSYSPRWTPDSKWLYWDKTNYSSSEMTFIRLSDKLEFKLNPPERTGSQFAFSHDGEKLLFYRPSYELFWGMKLASVSGGPPYEPVPHLPAFGAWWTKDSKMIIVQDDPVLKLIPISGRESYLMDLDINVEGKPCHFDVSPGQKYILFEIINENEKGDLYYAPISIKEARIVGPVKKIIENWTYTGGYNTKLSWSSDGNRLALIHNGDIWVYNCDGNDLKQITNTPENKHWVAWSPDGMMLSYQVFPDKPELKQRSRIISSNDGKSIKIIEDYLLWPYGWAPNSKSILYELDGKIVNHDIQTDEIKLIIDPKTKMLSWIPSYVWSPDGQYLILNARKESEPDKYYLYKIPAQGGILTELATGDSDAFKYNIEWSPDGKWICYCYMKMEKVRPESTIWEADYDEIMEKLAK
jgi:Tol biopolymer transport system component